jgi:hypothetical protein
MMKVLACLFSLAAVLLLVAGGDAQDQKKKKAKNNQMVAGTIKSVDVEKGVLVINQKVKNDKVDRELSITEDVEFEVGGKTATGSKGLDLIKDRVGASVKVKCDKDVNVLKVSVK